MRILSLVLAGVLLFSNSLYALDAPFIVASLPNLDLPQNRVKTEDDSGTMISVSLSGNTSTTATDDITWSWEEELEPLDILDYVQSLPYDEWIEIDEVTTRRLFEDLIQTSLNQMDLEEGGHFEGMLRSRFFYFTPEREYYFPSYEEDFSERKVLFPVKIMRVQSSKYDICKIALGRFSDDERDVKITFKNGQLKIVELDREQYYPGETGPKKIIKNLIGLYDDQTIVLEMWFNDNDGVVSTFIESQRLFEYEVGNSTPVVDNTEDKLALDLSGIELLFDRSYGWHAYGPGLFQTYSSLIDLCKLQLNILDQSQLLEKLLWKELFYYEDGFECFGVEVEFANMERIRDLDSSKEKFLFDVGNVYTGRDIDLILSKDFGDIEAGYEWGIESVVLTRNILLSDGELGQEKKVLSFNEGANGIEMSCWVSQCNANEEQVYNEQLAYFVENNPQNLALVSSK